MSQTKRGNRYPIQELVAEVKDQWYTLLAFLEWRKWHTVSGGHWSAEQEQDWRRTGWWDFDSATWHPCIRELGVTEKFYHSNGLQLSKALSFLSRPKPITAIRRITAMRKGLESEGPNALILLDPHSWKTMVSKFTKFHEINGDGSDPGEPQLMILQRFVRNEHGEDFYMLQDTHGLSGIRSAENEPNIIQIPAQELHAMFFTGWFVENRPQPIEEKKVAAEKKKTAAKKKTKGKGKAKGKGK